MKIKFISSTGCPYGQFLVEAETEQDMAILHNFNSADPNEWKFWRHGSTYNCDLCATTSFNFGYLNKKYFEKKRNGWWNRLRKLFR